MTRAVLSLVVLIALGRPADAQNDFATRILSAHNAERSVLTISPLTWSDALAADAAVCAKHLADTGAWAHADAKTRKGEGENLWEGTAGGYSLEEMVGAWTSEKRYFHYGPFPYDGRSDGQPVGHYTQMIWRQTTEVGCALVTGGGKDILVCRYSPMGNMVGEAPY